MFKKKWFKILLIVFIILVIAYQFGPHPATPVYSKTLPAVPSDTAALEQYITSNEAQHTIKPGNEARHVWIDPAKTKTA